MDKFAALKKFKKEYPKAAREIEYCSGIDVFYNDKAFFLNGEIQITGYQLGENREPLSQSDNENIAIKRIKEFKKGREELEKESLVDRFNRLINEAKTLTPKWRYYTSYRHVGGDKATIFDDGDLWINFTGIDYQISATGKKNRQEAIDECVKKFEAYTGAVVARATNATNNQDVREE